MRASRASMLRPMEWYLPSAEGFTIRNRSLLEAYFWTDLENSHAWRRG